MGRTFLKIVVWIFATLIVLFVLVWLVIQIPSVQNALVQKLTQSLSKTLQTEVSINRVNIRFFKTVVLEGIYVESLQNDTLLYAQNLGVNIGILDLFDNQIHVKKINLDGAKVQLYRPKNDSLYNYQFILDAFATKDPDTSATETAWTFGIDEVVIQDSYFRMLDEFGYSDVELNIEDFLLQFKTLDLPQQVIDVHLIRLKNSTVAYRVLQSPPKEVSEDSVVEVNPQVTAFPDLGWDLKIKTLQFEENTLMYEDQNAEPIANAVDFNHLKISKLNANFDDFAWKNQSIVGQIKDFSFQEQSGFQLDQLTVDLKIDTKEITITDFKLKTPETNVIATTSLSYHNFAELVNDFTEKVYLDINIDESYLAFQDLEYFAPSIKEIKELNTQLNKRIQFSAQAKGTINDLKNFVANLSIENGLELQANGSAKNLSDPEQLTFNVNLKQLSTSYQKMRRLTQNVALPQGLDSLGQFTLSGQFRGSLDRIFGANVLLKTARYTGFRGDLIVKNVTDPDHLTFDVKIQELKTEARDLNGFVENGLPQPAKNLGKIRYIGNLSGTLTKFNLNGNLQTDAGNAITDLSLDFNKNYSNAHYKGKVDLQDFELGKVLSDTTIGNVTLSLNGTGSGLTLDSIRAELAGVITAFEYNNYEYNDLHVDGSFNQKQFTGEANIADANLNIDFTGNINLNDSLPEFQFTANVDTINLQKLNFSSKFYGFSGKINANFSGINVDDLDGTASIQNLAISNDTASYHTDSIVLEANPSGTTGKLLRLQSEFLTATIEGDYNTADLPKLMENFVNDYFPIDQLMSSIDTPAELAVESDQSRRELPDQSFTALIQLDDPVPLLGLFVPGLEYLDTAFLEVKLNSKDRDLQIRGGIPTLVMQNQSFSNIKLEAEGTPEELKSVLTMEEIDYNGTQSLPAAALHVNLANDSLFVSIAIKEQAENEEGLQDRFAMAGNAFRRDSLYYFVFAPDFVLNGEMWSMPRENEVLYQNNYLDINNVSISKEKQKIAFQSTDEPTDQDFSPIVITFENFDVQEISELLQLSEDMYAGDVDGTVTLRNPITNLNYLVDLSISDIKLNEEPIGDLIVKAEQTGQESVIRIDATLDGAQSNATVTGTYAVAAQEFDLDASIQSLELQLLDPFSSGMIKESEGTLAGNFAIKGTPEEPKVSGILNLTDISTILGITGVRYTIPQEEIRIDNQTIDLGNLRLLDESNNEATLSGTLRYADISDMGLNLKFSTNRFPVLNTQSTDEALYYGTLVIAANVSIRGTVTKPIIDAQATTLEGSQLFVQPLTTREAVASQEDYIIFANPATFSAEDSTQNLAGAYQINRKGINLALNLEVTSDAELQIIIDPTSGDKLICKGNSNLTVEMNPNGEIDVTGSYQITSGSYQLNYQGLVKRKFDIRSGSRLDFIGDPLDTRFDVTAAYTTQTPSYELIRNQVTALTADQERKAKTRSPVTVILRMRGDLDEPIISFDIQMGEEGASPVTSVEAQALARLRDNPSELNKQVFSLLLFNSFLAETSGGGSLADAGTSVYLSSVSSLVTNQLNRLADRYIQGVEIDIGVESYQQAYDIADEGNTVTELQLGVRKQLFNDRLSVRVGGNVNVTSENSLLVEGADFSSIAGDFVLEYELTEKGNYILRVFRRENYDVLNQSNVPQTGVGISFRKSFQRSTKSEKKEKEKQKKANKSDAILPNNQKKLDKN